MIHEHDVMAVLRTIPDPEMPISIVDLGLVEHIAVASCTDRAASQVHIDLLPTFVGCPALDMIARDVRAKVGAMAGVSGVEVNWIFSPPWSVDRITPEGRAMLKEHGVTVPERGGRLNVPAHQAPQTVELRTSAVSCPFCGSSSTVLDSAFGPTRCRTIYYCESCRNSFERMKELHR